MTTDNCSTCYWGQIRHAPYIDRLHVREMLCRLGGMDGHQVDPGGRCKAHLRRGVYPLGEEYSLIGMRRETHD